MRYRHMHDVTFTPSQCRAARALIGMQQEELANLAKVARKTLADFEGSKSSPHPRTLDAIRAALETAGVEFIPENGGGAGVRLRRATKTYEGDRDER
ncbi:MAG: helix-turn-helix transcriptional regulator [Alphaproteobacteria bacterium]|nr:helix-turn-helix transcriptional regulator [Alphaproteobacteria bacterium]